MKMRVIVLGLLSILLSSTASADDWTAADTKRQMVYDALLAIDWGESHEIVKHQGFCDSPLGIGPHINTNANVNIYHAFAGTLQAIIAYKLPEELRVPFQYASIVVESRSVIRNKQLTWHTSF